MLFEQRDGAVHKTKIPTKLSCQAWHVFQRDYFLW